jgi:hypothetical protein
VSMSSVSHNIFDNSFITSFDPKLRAGVRAKTRQGRAGRAGRGLGLRLGLGLRAEGKAGQGRGRAEG